MGSAESSCEEPDCLNHSELSTSPATLSKFPLTEEPTTLDPGHPRQWGASVLVSPTKVYGQLLGLNPFKSTYASLYRSLDTPTDRLILFGGIVCAIAAGVPLPVIAVIFGRLISVFPPTPEELSLRVPQLLGVAVAFFGVTTLYAAAFGFIGERIANRYRKRLLDCVLHLDQAYLDTHDVDVHGLLTEKVDSIHAGCSEKAGICIQSTTYFVAACIAGFVLDPALTGILLSAIIPSISLIMTFTSAEISKSSGKVSQCTQSANGLVESALRALRTVQAFDMMEQLRSKHSSYLGTASSAGIRKSLFASLQTGSIYFITYAINALAFYVGSQMAKKSGRHGEAGTVFAVVLLIMDSTLVVASFAPFLETFARAAAANEEIQELLDARSVGNKPLQVQAGPCDLKGSTLTFENVTFAYPSRPSCDALSGLNLTIQPGEFVGIVGTSGGGKSTLVSLLTGMYDYQGSIRMGLLNLRDLDKDALRSSLAVVEQDPTLFSGTISDNISSTVRHEGLTAEALAARCRQAVNEANIDFLDELPRGLDSCIGDGLQLSGGQRQRICLARALISKPTLLILDECTSALDAGNEAAVMEAVKRVARTGTTVIMIAHRLSTVLDADRIVVLGEGKVVEQGSPLQLSSSGTVFRSLLDAQGTALSHAKRETLNPEKSAFAARRDSVLCPASHGKPSDCTGSDNSHPLEQHVQLNTRSIIRQVAELLAPERAFIVVGVLAAVINGLLIVGEAIIFGNLVELLNTGVADPDFAARASFFCLMFFALACVALLSWVCGGTAFGIASIRSVSRIQRRLFAQLLVLDMEFFGVSGRSVHELMAAFTKDSGDLSCLSGAALGVAFSAIASLGGGIILAMIVAWKIAVVLLAAVPVVLGAGFARIRVLVALDNRRRSAYRQATTLAAEACRHKKSVAMIGVETYMIERHHEALDKPERTNKHLAVFSGALLAMSLSAPYFVYALAYWWGAKQVRTGLYNQRQFFTVLPALLYSAQASGQLFNLSPELARARAAASSVLRLLCQRPVILGVGADSLGSERQTSLPPPPRSPDTEKALTIALDNVSLAYTSNPAIHVLLGVSLTIPAGMSVALVGPSGAGKSSVISLMGRFYDPVGGRVLFDGTDLRDLDINSIRDEIGLVSQDSDLLPGSIIYNVMLGAGSQKQVTEECVHSACRQVGMHDFIVSLPDGYNTECSSNGATMLSGGQRQRIALARALIREPEILLLDEPTSALDAHSEAEVQEALACATEGRTTVTVAHRLATIRHVDKIFVLDQGRIVEEGTHADLLGAGGLYASMAKAQALS